MQLRLPRFLNRTRSQESINSSGNQLPSSSSPQPQSTDVLPQRPRITVPPINAQVVILGEEGLTAVVPRINKMSLSSPEPLPDSPLYAPAAEPETANTSAIHFKYETFLTSQSIHLMQLPTELLIKISLQAGFLASLELMKTCTRFERILMDPRSWNDYILPDASSDVVESQVTICTKIHTFDHLVFGLWNPSTSPSAKASDAYSEPSVYFEHFTFNEQFDFLGGVNMGLSRTGQITSEFFEHKETLPCYKQALADAVQQGLLPATAPHGEPPAGAKIDHTCQECERYACRRVLKSIFVYDEAPQNPKWGKEGFAWTYKYSDGRRQITVKVTPYEGVVGYTSARDLPSVWVKKVNVNGVVLGKEEEKLFQKLVQRTRN